MQRLGTYLKNWRIAEQLVYWVIWLIIILLPLFFWDFSDYHERKRIVWGWMRITPFLIIFLIHNLVLLPIVLRKWHWSLYFMLSVLLILIVNYLFIYQQTFRDLFYGIFIRDEIAGRGMRGSGTGITGHGPGHGRYFKDYRAPGTYLYIYNLFISVLLIGFNATLNFTTRWLQKEQERKEIARENIQSQLDALQQQVSPHFFMNTLNNIHALIDYDKDSAREAVLRLSGMMRYLLYDSGHEHTSLQKEIDFLKSYIELMRLRISESLEISIRFPEQHGALKIPPFLFIPFVENAFKYGILAKGKSEISILIELVGERLHFNCRNSKSEDKSSPGEHSGLGISNAKKRLDLIFDNRYTLNIFDRGNEFEVDLVFPVIPWVG
jgi:hypothetical protein